MGHRFIYLSYCLPARSETPKGQFNSLILQYGNKALIAHQCIRPKRWVYAAPAIPILGAPNYPKILIHDDITIAPVLCGDKYIWSRPVLAATSRL